MTSVNPLLSCCRDDFDFGEAYTHLARTGVRSVNRAGWNTAAAITCPCSVRELTPNHEN